jgi:hypothetical protein
VVTICTALWECCDYYMYRLKRVWWLLYVPPYESVMVTIHTALFIIPNCCIFSVQHVHPLFNVLTINSEYFPKQHESGLVTSGLRNFKTWKIREMCSSVNNSVNIYHLPWNFHFCMKALVIVLCRCLSERIDCSLAKNEDRMRAENAVLTVKLSLQKHCYFCCIGKGTLNCFSFGHLGQQYIAGIVKCLVQCHVFTQSPLGRRPNDKFPIRTSHRSRFM